MMRFVPQRILSRFSLCFIFFAWNQWILLKDVENINCYTRRKN